MKLNQDAAIAAIATAPAPGAVGIIRISGRDSEIIADRLFFPKSGGKLADRPARSAVFGEIRGGKPGQTILLRADIDALPIQEETCLPYASQHDGKMHACGHDAHTAMLLGALKVLQDNRDTLRGNAAQALIHRADARAVGTGKLGGGILYRALPVGGYEICHGLGLGQIHFSV